MRRVQLHLTDEQVASLRALGQTRGVGMAPQIREALEDWIERQELGFPDGSEVASLDVVSVTEIARRTGRPVNTIQSWRRRHRDFPKPIVQLAAGPIWNWPAVEAWVASRGRVPASKTAELPGAELVAQGLADLREGRESDESLLLQSAWERLQEIGVSLPTAPRGDAAECLYARLVDRQGASAAHSQYNALRRRLVSYMNSASGGSTTA